MIEYIIEKLVEDGYILYGRSDGYTVLAHKGNVLRAFEYEKELKGSEAREWLQIFKETDSLHRLSVSKALWVLTEDLKYLPVAELLPQGVRFAQCPIWGDWASDSTVFTKWTVHHHLLNPRKGVNELWRSLYDLQRGVSGGEYNSRHTKCRAISVCADSIQYIDVEGQKKTLDIIDNHTYDGWV